MSEPNMLAEARAYVERGLKIVPLHTPVHIGGEWRCSCGRWPCPYKTGKHPRLGYGPARPIADAAGVAEAWGRWPDANIGIVVPAGLFVAELDGAEAIEWWEERAGAGVTRTTLSGSGEGQHRWYRGLARGGTLETWGPHREVVIREGDANKLLVAPPSLHETGRRYKWLHDVPAAVATPELLQAIGASQPHRNGSLPQGNGGRDYFAEAAGKVRDQGRDTLILSYLGSLAGKVRSAETLLVCAQDLDAAFGESLGEDKLIQHVNYVADKAGLGAAIRATAMVARLEESAGKASKETGRPDRAVVWKTDPPRWLWYFPEQSKPLECTDLREFYEPAELRKAYLRRYLREPTWRPERGEWPDLRSRLRNEAEHIEPPPELTVDGKVKVLLATFVNSSREDIEVLADVGQRGVWHDTQRERFVFRLSSLLAHHHDRYRPGDKSRLSDQEVGAGIRRLGGETGERVRVPDVEERGTGRVTPGKQIRVAWVPTSVVDGE